MNLARCARGEPFKQTSRKTSFRRRKLKDKSWRGQGSAVRWDRVSEKGREQRK